MVSLRNICNCFMMVLGFLAISAIAAGQAKDTIPVLPPGVEQPALGPNDTIPVPAIIANNQLIPSGTLEWYWVTAPYPKHLLKKRQEWTRLRNAIYVTYPYARKSGYIINEINAKLAGVTDKEERKKYLKTREKELKKEFADPLSNLSVYQGKVLMKLINRQTGNNCYEIIKEYKGGFTAVSYTHLTLPTTERV